MEGLGFYPKMVDFHPFFCDHPDGHFSVHFPVTVPKTVGFEKKEDFL